MKIIKISLILIFLISFSLGYWSMHIYDSKVIKPGQVLSQNSQNILPTQSPVPSPTDTPVPTQIPVPTLVPTLPPPTPTRIIRPPQDLEPLFDEFSKNYSVDKQKLMKIADCESHFNRGVYAQPYAGMYQFTESSWTKYRTMMGKDPNIDLRFGARESIETAAFIISIKNEHIWPVCSK